MEEGNIFVIQKHYSKKLHYDFRLEISGVLKSWAIPKGIPSRIGEKKLAISVEDHELSYANFEGIIPEGNYGAGKVEIYDKGVYENLKKESMKKCFEKGDIKIILNGEKIKGSYSLIKVNFKEKNSWLLIKINLSDKQNI